MIKIGKVNFTNIEALIKQAEPKIDNASSFLANEIKKYAKPYTPYRSGELEKSLKFIKEKNRVVALLYDIVYASRLYYGGSDWKYNTSVNPQARPRWIEASWQIHHQDIINNVNKALKNV